MRTVDRARAERQDPWNLDKARKPKGSSLEPQDDCDCARREVDRASAAIEHFRSQGAETADPPGTHLTMPRNPKISSLETPMTMNLPVLCETALTQSGRGWIEQSHARCGRRSLAESQGIARRSGRDPPGRQNISHAKAKPWLSALAPSPILALREGRRGRQ
jgi:hypothetical protein